VEAAGVSEQAMSEENVEIVRRHFEAWNRRDLMTLLALWRSDAEIDWSRSRGPLKGCLSRSSRARDLLEGVLVDVEEVQLETHSFTEAGSEVVVGRLAASTA
jgi:ketosteroid isomerase-like protein